MSIIDTLITDRTSADVQAVKNLNAVDMSTWSVAEVTAYLADMKGAYNASDLNRVGQACAYLYDVMTAMGYDVPNYTALKTDWVISDVPTQAQMATYITTVAALKALWSAIQTIPSTMDALTYQGANDIEKLLVEVEDISQRIQAIYIKSGAWNAFSGTGFYIKEGE